MIGETFERTSGQANTTLARRQSPIDGSGCFATISFAKNEPVAQFIGERISCAEAELRRRGKRRYAICALDEDWAIDANVGGNCTRYLNHSCAPNCEVRVEGGRIMIYASRSILAGEEITVDYECSYHSNRKRCRCGAANCPGTINQPDANPESLLAEVNGRPRDSGLPANQRRGQQNSGEDSFPQTR